jgi:cyclic pyranopterin phosphate synthase
VTGNGPACYFQVPGAPGKLGFISAVSNHFCSRCNRIRLTADGQLRPCLFDQRELDLRHPLRAGASDRELAEIFEEAISLKPSSYHEVAELTSEGRGMCQIGG